MGAKAKKSKSSASDEKSEVSSVVVSDEGKWKEWKDDMDKDSGDSALVFEPGKLHLTKKELRAPQHKIDEVVEEKCQALGIQPNVAVKDLLSRQSKSNARAIFPKVVPVQIMQTVGAASSSVKDPEA